MTGQNFVPRVVWTEIPTADPAAAAAFYCAVLEAPFERKPMGGEEPSWYLPYADGQPSMNFKKGTPANGTGPVVHFSVPDAVAAAERARTAGGRVLRGPIDIPNGRMIYLDDPEGNPFSVFQTTSA